MWCNPPVNGSLVTSVKPTCPLGREEVNFSSFSVSTGSVLSSGEKILEKECTFKSQDIFVNYHKISTVSLSLKDRYATHPFFFSLRNNLINLWIK